ncbi:MAG: hypothetical protein OS130_08800 [Thermodesulfobacteriota bacterium]|jgi:hypothetical protein|nr:MAG: hypothetical protein OS130_08800 [Thermodesulfobacteriota bacterium]
MPRLIERNPCNVQDQTTGKVFFLSVPHMRGDEPDFFWYEADREKIQEVVSPRADA